MVDALRTISPKDFSEFVAKVMDPSNNTLRSSSLSSQCLVVRAKQCPDQALETPRCGKCPIALADELSMVEQMQEGNGFQVKSVPHELWYANTIMDAQVTHGSGVVFDISHSAGRVQFEFYKSPPEQEQGSDLVDV